MRGGNNALCIDRSGIDGRYPVRNVSKRAGNKKGIKGRKEGKRQGRKEAKKAGSQGKKEGR